MSARINTDERSPGEVLMDSLAEIEGAERVVILVEKKKQLAIKTNCTHRELHWMLSQANYCVMLDLFSPSREDLE